MTVEVLPNFFDAVNACPAVGISASLDSLEECTFDKVVTAWFLVFPFLKLSKSIITLMGPEQNELPYTAVLQYFLLELVTGFVGYSAQLVEQEGCLASD